MRKIAYLLLVLVLIFYASCVKDKKLEFGQESPTPYIIEYPSYFTPNNYIQPPADNPLTEEGVELGRKLFYETMLSANNSQSCASCHNQSFAFTDNGLDFSVGVTGEKGTRNAMPLFNLAYQESKSASVHKFFWDGAAPSLERQSIVPIQAPNEMAGSLPVIISRLQAHPFYPKLFKKAFGTDSIYTLLIQKAIAQFERTLLSFNSKYDQYLATRNLGVFTESERNGLLLFISENNPALGLKGADCFHCHGADKSVFMTDFQMHNNGLSENPTDSGLFRITNQSNDIGKFKTPSLRNLAFTAPYMHDGSLKTLEEVIDFYDSGVKNSPWVDPLIAKHLPLGLQLTLEQKQDLIAFLQTMTDSSFIKNTKFAKP
ncbi:MAG: cytochrome c peroxidase [Bacteroidota bacterium]